ncbi:protein-S-isoprenylcysteine O-methyltransferase [Jannaschia sp. S6380]|uniref:protein-S-isoprenylcysteine O-methyltransferase n=1 Tax=Jannaschia sp. S6380 TaxID=2926408 RepID=UPI001FF5920A|nr:protein-S-isoprenylcysteine O-methyltransferase [Jannaschia sp. S6380]MCK0166862.1 protein-S-isoprenylcysteine O-methyltransferase [Jannaschia sp. S6380]
MPIAMAALVITFGGALVMILWDVLVEKVHLRPSTGMDYSAPRDTREILPIVGVKVLGLYATLGLIALIYMIVPVYSDEKFDLYFLLSRFVMPMFLALAPLYIFLVTRYMVEPRDKLWHFGRLLTGGRAEVDPAQVKDHALGWAIKGFFLAFLGSIVVPVFGIVLIQDIESVTEGLGPFFLFVLKFILLFDVAVGGLGYLMTFRPLDSHIRSANPHLSAWVVALICYPPFVLMGKDGPLNYHEHTLNWSAWLEGMPTLLVVWGLALAALTFLYSWATVIFGIRFSNLTHRGIVTTGPYRYFKHPAYLAKNSFWWLMVMPFLTTADDPMIALRNCILLAAVNAVYYARARTEELHLMADPNYRAYSEWIAEHGLLPRLRRRLTGRGPRDDVQIPAE